VTIERVPEVPFAQIANGALRDRRLSFKARGILALVLSNVGEWEATAGWIESQSDNDGREAVRSALQELSAYGYRVVTVEQDGSGLLRKFSNWHHLPVRDSQELMQINRPSDKPTIGETDHRITRTLIEHHPSEHYLEEHKRTIDQPAVDRFDDFWSVYPRRVGKQLARKAFREATRSTAVDEIIDGARRYRDDQNRADKFTAHPTTWLRRGSWDDDALPCQVEVVASAGQRRMNDYQNLLDRFDSSQGETVG